MVPLFEMDDPAPGRLVVEPGTTVMLVQSPLAEPRRHRPTAEPN